MSTHVDNYLRFHTCPLCNSLEIAKVDSFSYAQPTYFSSTEIVLSNQPELWKCKFCDSSFVQNIIPEEIAKSLYCQGDSDQRWKSEAFLDSKSIHLTKILQSIFQENLKVLDIGCNTGELLDLAKLQGCQTFGIEYSESSQKVLKEKGHIVFSEMQNKNEHFNIITAFDLVEHIYNVPEFLNNYFDKLSQDGYFIIFTGNIGCMTAQLLKGKWWYVGWPEHIVFPSIKYFKIYNKFKIVEVVKTYHSNYFRTDLKSSFKLILKSIIEKRYSGVPTIQDDHFLIILQK